MPFEALPSMKFKGLIKDEENYETYQHVQQEMQLDCIRKVTAICRLDLLLLQDKEIFHP